MGKNLSSEQEQDLVVRIMECDESAFEELYQQYFDQLYHYAFQILKDDEEVEDIIQDTFMYIWRNRTRLVIRHRLTTYLAWNL